MLAEMIVVYVLGGPEKVSLLIVTITLSNANPYARYTIVQNAVCDCMSSVRPSVRLSVTLLDQGHIGWKSWKLITRPITPNTFALPSSKAIHSIPGEHGEIWRRVEVRWEKVACWSTKAAISLKRVKIEETLLLGGYI